MVIELIDNDIGSGVIISSRDVSRHKAVDYSSIYVDMGCEVIIDFQFCKPDFVNSKTESYETNKYRVAISRLKTINDKGLAKLQKHIESINKDLSTTAVLAPAVKYEAGRPDICDLNQRLFEVSKNVGDALSVPTYSTIILGSSITSSIDTINSILSEATSLNCNGWYFGFEFDTYERVPSQTKDVYNCCLTLLKLACTGKPVLHAFAGPLGLLSMGAGATGVGIGHYQNLWQFTRGRFEKSENAGGGGGDAPARYFSKALWGTIVYPDEIQPLDVKLRNIIHTASPFSPESFQNLLPWAKWSSYKHLLYVIGDTLIGIGDDATPRERLQYARDILQNALKLHRKIPLELKDNSDAYQGNWIEVIDKLTKSNSEDYDYLSMLI
jgi:hypothetical protein